MTSQDLLCGITIAEPHRVVHGEALPMIYGREPFAADEIGPVYGPRCVTCRGYARLSLEANNGGDYKYAARCLCGRDIITVPFKLVLARTRRQWAEDGALRPAATQDLAVFQAGGDQ